MTSGGGPISRWPAIASANGRFILTPASTTVKVFSAVSGALTSVLKGHVAEVTAAVLVPNTDSQVRNVIVTYSCLVLSDSYFLVLVLCKASLCSF